MNMNMNRKLKQLKKRLCTAGIVIAASGITVPAAIGVLHAESVYADVDVSINTANFPDESFRKYVLEYIDKDGDGKLSEDEISACKQIHCGRRDINSLKGIEFFKALDNLYCYGNNLSSLDLSKNEKLWYLDCSNNHLSNLDVSANVALEELHCGYNKLSSIDVSKNIALEELYCSGNNLSSLDVSKNVALWSLTCRADNLKSLDVSKNVVLEGLYCSGNNLSSLDVSKNVELLRLDCTENKLSSLDVSKNVALRELYCSNNKLSSLDVSKNVNLEELHCRINNLISLDVSKNGELWMTDDEIPREWFCQLQNKNVTAVDGIIDLSAIDPALKASDISNLKGATLSGERLTNIIGDTVTYDYATGYLDLKMDVTLHVDHAEITPESVSIDKKLLVLGKGKSGKLTATVNPDNAKDKTVTWSSSNTGVAKVDSIGNVTAVNHGTAYITAKTSNGKTVTCEVRVSFADVASTGLYYYKPVYWAASKGITTGYNGKFYPNDSCTREEAITFLWRMYGKPMPKSMNSKFSDVKDKNRYSYNAIMWGTENGIITGSNGKFTPTAICTREQIITMLWRVAGRPDPRNMTSKFSDVKNTNSYSYKAILWASQNGIATGSNGKFYPATKCKRCEIITFIYRYKN